MPIRLGRGGGGAGDPERGESEEKDEENGMGECDLATLPCLDSRPPPPSCTARLSSNV